MKKVHLHSILKLNYNFSFEKFLFFSFYNYLYSDFMDGFIDLETYTISLIRINNALSKLEENNTDETEELFSESFKDMQKVYLKIVEDLNHNELNMNEYYLFFQNGKQTFPHYIEALENIENKSENVDNLINVFNNLNKIAEAFENEGYDEL